MSEYNRGNNSPRPQGRPQSGASRFGTAQPRRGAPNRGTGSGGRPASARAAGPSRGPAPSRGAAAPRSAAPARGGAPAESRVGGALPRGFWPLVGVCVLVIVLGVLLQAAMPEGFPLVTDEAKSPRRTQLITEIHGRGPVRLNEIMTANGGVLTDDSGETPDWVEVANVGSSPVNLEGYVLARKVKSGNVFVFPDMVLQPSECAIVFADSHYRSEPGEELHAPFRLSADGDVLMLFNQADVAIDTVNIPALPENAVYARQNAGSWAMSDRATPGMPNTDESYRALTTVEGTGDAQLVELMSSSRSYAPDENGVCHDYVIIRAASGAGVDLGGWYLSDSQQLPRMWRFPEGTYLQPGETLLVHCSGLNRADNPAHLHTNFKLSSEGEQVVLSNASGRPVDMVTFDLIGTDSAYVRGADGSWSVGAPTAPAVESAGGQ